MLINGWHSDKTAERYWHTAIPLLAAGLMFGLLTPVRHEVPLAIACLASGQWVLVRILPSFLGDTDMMLSDRGSCRYLRTNQFDRATRRIGRKLRNRFSQRSDTLAYGKFRFVALVYVAAGGLILSLRVRDPLDVS